SARTSVGDPDRPRRGDARPRAPHAAEGTGVSGCRMTDSGSSIERVGRGEVGGQHPAWIGLVTAAADVAAVVREACRALEVLTVEVDGVAREPRPREVDLRAEARNAGAGLAFEAATHDRRQGTCARGHEREPVAERPVCG